ncbi:MAG: MBL fold metallo-hydrolase [Betaproteobacteria bacterium]|nr:MBL fold metallo-hydrolase [Betaproteobacteria bacterium]
MTLPGQIQVLERGWLSSNNIVLSGRDGNILVDAGYVTHAPQTLALVEHALNGGRVDHLVNTHCHSDHMGGNHSVQKKWHCRTSIPVGEAPLIERWDEDELLLAFADQQADRFRIDDTYAPGDTLRMGELDWQVLAAPGHDQHALMLYSPDERVLISGDALWQNGFGVIFSALFGRPEAFAETRTTLDSIAALGVRTVIPGHGAAFEDVQAALERAYRRLDGFERNITRLAQHCIKVLFAFSLLDKREMPLKSLPDYVARVPIIVRLNREYLGMTAVALAEYLVTDLERAGAARRQGEMLVPGNA